MHTITINVQDGALDKILYLLKNLSDIEIVETKEQKNKIQQDDDRWTYWTE